MPQAPPPLEEPQRLQALREALVLDTDPEQRFDEITETVRKVLGVPIALISLVDADRQWFKSCLGLDVQETPRAQSFCAYAILSSDPFVIENAETDPRVLDNPLVTGPPHIRSYLGVPLNVSGYNIGTLCAIDVEPRVFEPWHVDMLKVLARSVEREIAFKERAMLVAELDRAFLRARVLFHEAPSMLTEIDREGRIVSANEAAEFFWAASFERRPEVFKEPCFARWNLREACESAGRSGSESLEPLRVELADGREHYLRCEVKPLGIDGNSYLLAIEDVTESVLAAAEQNRLTLAAEAEREAAIQARLGQDQFAARLGHEMRNPLNGIVGIIDVFGRDRAEISEENLATLRSCVDTLTTLIDDTLDLERLQQGRISIVSAPFDLETLVHETGVVTKKSFEKPEVDLRFEFGLESRGVEGDAVRVRQLLTNLISNAVKYTDRGQILVSARSLDGRATFEVQDTGAGIPTALQPYIFDPYRQAQEASGDSKLGVGLGLAITKHLVEAMDGRLEFESEHGVGSTFRLTLPLPQASLPERKAATCPQLDLNVLVADDNRVNRQILRAQMASLGCHVTTAEDGQGALQALREMAHDVVMMDCQMPVMDGFEAAGKIKARGDLYGAPHIIALTGSVDEATRLRCLASGMDDFLSKPVSFHQLTDKLQSRVAELSARSSGASLSRQAG